MTNSKFSNYFSKHKPALNNFARKLTKNDVEAQDLLQETAIKAYRGMHNFREDSSFKSWAFTIMKNTFITHYNKRRKRAVVNAPIEDFTFALQSAYTTRNDAVSSIRVNEIKENIEDLSLKSKMPLIMHIKGFKYNEISQKLNIPIGTVKSRINFARKKLKEVLQAGELKVA